jgi:hypothetical protein
MKNFKLKNVNDKKKFDSKYNKIVIDFNNLFYQRVVEETEKGIEGLYKNFVKNPYIALHEKVDSLINKFAYDSTEIYFLADNPNSIYYKRRELDSSYKHRREQNFTTNFLNRCMDFTYLSLKQKSNRYVFARIKEYEADDLVKPLLEIINPSYYNNVLLISNDMDWSRSISDNVSWYNYRDIMSKEVFYKKYKFFPTENSVKIYKSIHGDLSDAIPNAVPHLPEDLLYYIVSKYKSINELFNGITNDSNLPLSWKTKILEAKDRIQLNYRLVDFVPLDKEILKENIVYGKKDDLSFSYLSKIIDENLKVEKVKEKNSFFEKRIKIK